MPTPPFDPAQEAQRLNNLREQRDVRQAITDLSAQQLDLLSQEANLRVDAYSFIQTELVNRQRLVDISTRQLELMEKTQKAGFSIEENLNREVQLNSANLEIAKQKLKVETEADEIKKLEKQIELLEKRNKAILEGLAPAKELGESIGAAFRIEGAVGFTAQLGKIGKALKLGKKGVLAFGAAAASSIAAAVIDSMVGLVIQVYDAENAFRLATGANQEFAQSLTATYEELRDVGVNLEDASKSTQSLYKSFTDFTMMDTQVRDDLIKTSAVLSKFGVSTDDFAKGIQTATKALGVMPEAADETMLGMRALAMDIGVMPQQMMADFAAAGGQLAKFGLDGTKAFKDVAIASKITGMEIPKILSLVEKFDTFEGAAEQAGKLNAALGGNFVNAMDLMMETDPAARFNMIRDAILNTGLTFDDMSYYQKQFYKDSLGLADVGELALMLSGDMSMLDDSIGKNSQSFIDAAAEAKQLQSFQDLLRNTMLQFIPVLKPVVIWLQDMALYLSENREEVTEMIEKVVSFGKVLMGLVAVLKVAALFIAAGAAPLWGLLAAIVAVGAAYMWVKGIFTGEDTPDMVELLKAKMPTSPPVEVKDALIQEGKVVHMDPKDTVLAFNPENLKNAATSGATAGATNFLTQRNETINNAAPQTQAAAPVTIVTKIGEETIEKLVYDQTRKAVIEKMGNLAKSSVSS